MSVEQPTPKPYLVKLVRDRVGDLLADSTVEYRPIEDRDEAIKLLRGKLIEEAVEYVLDPCIGELADVVAVAYALNLLDLGESAIDLEAEIGRKERSRGGFRERMGMWAPTTAGKWRS